MNKCKNIKLGLVMVLVLQLVLSPFSGASFAYLSGYELSKVLSTALNAMGNVWWSPGDDNTSAISLLSSTTRDVQNKTFNPCTESQRSFIVQGYNILASADSNSNLFKTTTNLKTTAVIQKITDAGTQDVTSTDVVYSIKNSNTSVEDNTNLAFDSTSSGAISQYYRYINQSLDSRYYSSIANAFELQDQVGFKFKVYTNKLGTGNFRVVVRTQGPADDSSTWHDSAIIPFNVERDNVFKITSVTNNGTPAPDSGFGTATNPTWKVEDRGASDTITFDGYYLSGKLGSDKKPVSVKEIELSMTTMGGDSVSSKVYISSGDTNNIFSTLTETLPTDINTNVNYDRTTSDYSADDQRFNFHFKGQLTLTSSQMALSNRYNNIAKGLKTINFSIYQNDPGAPRGSLIKTETQNVYLDIPAQYTSTTFTAGGAINFTDASGLDNTTRPTLTTSSDPYTLTISGYYHLVGNCSIKKVEVSVAGNGDTSTKTLTPTPITDSTATSTYHPYTISGTYSLNMSRLYALMPNNSTLNPIIVNVTITDDLGKVYRMSKTLYSLKSSATSTATSTQSLIATYMLAPSEAASPRSELAQSVTQTLNEATWLNADGTAKTMNIEGIVLTGATSPRPGIQQTPRYDVVSLRATSSLNRNIYGSDTSPHSIGQDADSTFVSTYYPQYNANVTNGVYKFTIPMAINFKTAKSGTATLYVQAQLRERSTQKLSTISITRNVKIVKLGEGKTKNTINTVTVPKNNDTVTLPAVTRYNRSSNISIPVSGVFLDGSYVGVDYARVYFDNKYMFEATVSDLASLSAYKGVYNTFTTDGTPSADGSITRTGINVGYSGNISITNSDKMLSSRKHIVKVVVKTLDGRVYNTTRSITISRFKELHAPVINVPTISAGQASVTANIYDIDLDIASARYKIDSDGAWVTLTLDPPVGSKSTTSVSLTSGTHFLFIEAFDKTGRSTSTKVQYTK